MNILYVTSEAVPFCKTGGLADVAGSLPQALAANGDRVSVILPLYERVKDKWGEQLHFEKWTFVRLAWRSIYCGLFSLERDGVTWYFVDNETYFRRSELYGYYDDGERFGFFSRAVTELLKSLPQKPDVVHCNDWQSALVPIYIRDEAVRDDFYKGIRTVITVHNIEYQGRYGSRTVEDLFGLDHGWFDGGTIEFGGDVNLLKGAIVTADAVTAVSPTYAQELKYAYFAHGLENVMSMNARKLHGVLNGIDMQRYDPSHDKSLAAVYSERRRTRQRSSVCWDCRNGPIRPFLRWSRALSPTRGSTLCAKRSTHLWARTYSSSCSARATRSTRRFLSTPSSATADAWPSTSAIPSSSPCRSTRAQTSS